MDDTRDVIFWEFVKIKNWMKAFFETPINSWLRIKTKSTFVRLALKKILFVVLDCKIPEQEAICDYKYCEDMFRFGFRYFGFYLENCITDRDCGQGELCCSYFSNCSCTIVSNCQEHVIVPVTQLTNDAN